MGTLARRRELAVITDASNGIGFELAKQFAEHGFDLVVAAKSDKIEDAARELAGTGVIVDAVKVDLATAEGVNELVRHIRATGRHVDTIAIDVDAGADVVHLAKLVARDMAERGRGEILFTASISSSLHDELKDMEVSFTTLVTDFVPELVKTRWHRSTSEVGRAKKA